MTSKARSLRTLLALVGPHRRAFSIAMLALLGGSGINLLLPEVIRRMLSPEWLPRISERPELAAVVLAGLFALQGLFFFYRAYLFGEIGQKIVASLRARLYSTLIYRELRFFDEVRTGELVSRLGSDTLMIQDAVSIKLSVLLRYSVQVLAGAVLMVWLSLRLSVAILIVLPLLVALSFILGRKLRASSRVQQSELARATTIAEETMSGVRVVKAFNQEQAQIERYQAANTKTLLAGLERTHISAFFSSFVSFLLNLAILVVVLYGVSLVRSAAISSADLTAFLMYGVIVAVSFAFVTNGYAELLQSLGAADRVFELLLHESTVGETASAAAPLGAITFADVAFAYPTRPDVPVLTGINFTLREGRRTAIVGASGSGKSTLAALLLRFYDPQRGSIRCAAGDLHTLTPAAVRTHIAYVPQDPQLFGMTIRENLRFGKPDATDAELEEACSAAQILDFVKALPHGLDTEAGERGVQLSGGQKQRLAIARALLRDPEVLILDEATSALDSESEHLVQQALDNLMRGRTVLVIAHRLSSVRDAEEILVLENGKIVQRGSHEELCRIEGLYRHLVARQELSAPAAQKNACNGP